MFCCVDDLLCVGCDEHGGIISGELEPNVEFESGNSMDRISVQGRLKNHAKFWLDELDPSSFVKEIVSQGYRIPFIRLPDPVCYRNHRSAIEHADFVQEAIRELVALACVIQCPECPKVCSPLSVVVNARGKKRLVLDLRYVNQFILLTKFKYEGLYVIPQIFSKGDYFFTFDLKSGYHHVDIHEDCWPYLGFSWGSGPDTRWYAFKVLPFGLASACYVFTKLLRPLVKRWRSMGLCCVVYIDDGICAAKSEPKCNAAKEIILSDLDSAGFILSISKCMLDPVQRGDWLGFTLDLRAGSFFVPGEKVSRLQSTIASLNLDRPVRVRALSSVVGQIISMSLAIGPMVRLRTRACYDVINQRKTWSDSRLLTEEAKAELHFWKECLPLFNGQPIWFESSATRVAYSDASSSGYGGYVVEIGPSISHGHWSPQEAAMSSTWRELRAVFAVLQSFTEKLQGHTVKWFTDNQNVVRIVQNGSKKPHLQEGAMAIFQICLQHCIKLEMEWIPRTKNELADYASWIVDLDDWRVSPSVFNMINSIWGPHTVDRFASPCNTQLDRFNSKFWCPGTEAVDAFTVDWGADINWLVPPLHLIANALQHAKACRAKGTLAFPAWKSSYFWPLVCPDGRHLAEFIHSWCYLAFSPELLVAGKSGCSLGDALTVDSVFMFVWFDFSAPPRSIRHGFCTMDFFGAGCCAGCSLVWPLD